MNLIVKNKFRFSDVNDTEGYYVFFKLYMTFGKLLELGVRTQDNTLIT